MIHEVEPALKKYAGRELELLRKLHAHYVRPNITSNAAPATGMQFNFLPTYLAKSGPPQIAQSISYMPHCSNQSVEELRFKHVEGTKRATTAR